MELTNLQTVELIREYIWLIIPLIGAAIGWITNYLAVKMLFRPRKKINLLLFSIQGVFPKRQKALAEKVGELVSKELLSEEQLGEKLSAAVKDLDLKEIIVEQMDSILLEKIPEAIPMAAMFINNELANLVKGVIAKELEPVSYTHLTLPTICSV